MRGDHHTFSCSRDWSFLGFVHAGRRHNASKYFNMFWSKLPRFDANVIILIQYQNFCASFFLLLLIPQHSPHNHSHDIRTTALVGASQAQPSPRHEKRHERNTQKKACDFDRQSVFCKRNPCESDATLRKAIKNKKNDYIQSSTTINSRYVNLVPFQILFDIWRTTLWHGLFGLVPFAKWEILVA